MVYCVYDTENEKVLMWDDPNPTRPTPVNYLWADRPTKNYGVWEMLCCDDLDLFNHDLISESPRFIKDLREEIEKNEWSDEKSLVDLKLRYLKAIRIVRIIEGDLDFTVSHKFDVAMYHEFAGGEVGWQL